MNLSYKIISLCLCFSVVMVASDINHNVKQKINTVNLKEIPVVAGHPIDYEPSSRECADSFVVYGSDPEGTYYGVCWSDGSGYFYFYWEGGCTALDIEYSGGILDLAAYGFTEGFYFYGFPAGATETFIMNFDDGSTGVGEATSDCVAECGDGSCNGDETFESCPEDCDESGCGNDEVIDCSGDGDCCPAAWIGDGYADCTDQAYNCDLTCYDCDGGDCPDSDPGCGGESCEDQGLVTCPDFSCAESYDDCPELSCADAGGNDAWIADGWCDFDSSTANNNIAACQYDGGDCCPGDCVSTTYACEEYGGDCTTCADCDSADNAPGGQCEGDGVGEGDDCDGGGGGDECADYDVAGDVNNDDAVNVLDIVSVVNHILGDLLEGCPFGAADMNADGEINVLDIVSIVNVILGGRSDNATSATMNIEGNTVSISGNGFIGAVQMTLSHGSDFSIDLTSDAMVADYRTNGNTTVLIVVVPGSDEIFTAAGDFEVVEVIVASGDGYVSTSTPVSFSLSAAYPNPFNPSTSLDLTMPSEGFVSVKAYNLAGQVVEVIAEGNMSAGTHNMIWDASDLSSGVYLVRAEYAGNVATQKVMFAK